MKRVMETAATSDTKVRDSAISDQMSLATCVPNPQSDDDFFISVHKWMLVFCKGNKCAAFLLANFIVWQNWKIRTDAYNKHLNDIAEQHGEPRRLCEDVWLFKSYEGLSESILYLFGVKTIKEALKFLEAKGVISIHSTPNKNHHYDKRNYFRFYPEVVKNWQKNVYPKLKKAVQEKLPNASGTFSTDEDFCEDYDQKITQVVESSDAVKVPDAFGKNAEGTGKNADTINYKHITNKNNKSINALEGFDSESKKFVLGTSDQNSIQSIIDALIAKGMPAKRFYPDAVAKIQELHRIGITLDIFLNAYDIAKQTTEQRGDDFNVPYLITVVKSLLTKSKQEKVSDRTPSLKQKDNFSNESYEEDMTNAIKWMKGSA
jgi:hypothetical protein